MTEEKEDRKEKGMMDDSAFDTLEKDFQEVLQELQGNKGLDKFKLEYEKLMRALQKSHESEKRLMQKCRELKAEIVANSAKMTSALKLSEEDQATIASLKKEIEKAWKMVDAAHDKEARARDTIQSLKLEIANLSKLVEQGAGLTSGQDQNVSELLEAKEELTKQRDELMQQNSHLRDELEENKSQKLRLETDLTDCQTKVAELEQEIQTKNSEATREQRKKEKMERDLKQAKAEAEAKEGEIQTLRSRLAGVTQENKTREEEIRATKAELEKAQRHQHFLETKIKDDTMVLNDQRQRVQQLIGDNQSKTLELKQREDEVNSLKSEIQKLVRVRETTLRKLRLTEDNKSNLEGQREQLKNEIHGMEKEMDLIKKANEQDKKVVDELTRERDILNKNLIKAANATEKQRGMVKLHEASKKTLEQEIENYKDEAQKQRKIIYQLEKERDRYINEASDLTQKVLQHMEDVKVREMQIFDYKKKIAEAETRLRQQQNLYEAVRSDRNLYSKNLIEAQDEITELKRKHKIMSHQIDQLKEETAMKDGQLVKENMERQKVEKEKDQLSKELQAMKKLHKENSDYIEAQEVEKKKLTKMINEADAERLRQKKELDKLVSERDILGTQLVRRNDELALLYEKIKIQQSLLNKGEVQYNQRLEDIRVLKLEIKKLRREKALLQRTVHNVDELRREVYHLQKELLRERTRCKALEEELENPMNVHRWRKLEGSDPSTYEMIQKIQTLQKRLILKTEEVVEKELLIQEKEKLYIELKHILARQPGPEVAEQLSIYQQTLRDKTKQMKAMAAETNMYESQIKEYKYEIEKLARELQEVKKKYFQQKKKEQAVRERERAIEALQMGGAPGNPPIQPQRTDQARFTGGGFSLTKTKG
ncbi:hypothetical protein BOX15_Mlig023212g2 [Macrostomum lignano]|uniref:Cilia- and flagella-associated protein 58 n=2 Tax=Macrostomum lignano TaxID=282301 RepID=A0A1I8GJV9_9PLAT|nr:hypothetical protein BOX15_Mlig023212g2 [Macrostomum lignano]